VSAVEICFRHEAELDALSYFHYLHDRNPDAAVKFLTSVDRTVENLALHPLMGSLRRFRGRDLQSIRSWRVNGFENYLIFYRFEGNRLEILHIKHGAMKFPRALRGN